MNSSTPQTIDIVIPTHKKDLQILEYCIQAAKEKIVGAGRVFVISRERYTDNAEWIDERIFPFSIEMVREQIGGTFGWYFQQLLKFYAAFVIPGISENILVLDSDTVFFRRVKMIDNTGCALFNITRDTNPLRSDFDQRVAVHTEKILPALATKNLPAEFQNVSGISHCMVFNREILRELFAKVEAHHGGEKPFYQIFLECADTVHSASEYQIYFCYMLVFHPKRIRVRKLNFKNTSDINIKKYRLRRKYDYCSFHSYLRGSRSQSVRVKLEQCFKNFWRKIFYSEIYNIGITNFHISRFLNFPNQKINWIKRQKFSDSYRNAGGFISQNGEKNIFAEKLDIYCGEVKICNLQLNDRLEIIHQKELLRNHRLLQILSAGDENFALVKNCQNDKIPLYKIDAENNFKWLRDLPQELDIADAALAIHNGVWWLFFAKKGAESNALSIATSDNLLNPQWSLHPSSPYFTGPVSNQPGGNIFFQGPAFRPTKNSDTSICLNLIQDLNAEKYQEIKEVEIFPDQLGSWPHGICSINALGENATILSGRKFCFSPLKPLIFLLSFCFGNANKRRAN